MFANCGRDQPSKLQGVRPTPVSPRAERQTPHGALRNQNSELRPTRRMPSRVWQTGRRRRATKWLIEFNSAVNLKTGGPQGPVSSNLTASADIRHAPTSRPKARVWPVPADLPGVAPAAVRDTLHGGPAGTRRSAGYPTCQGQRLEPPRAQPQRRSTDIHEVPTLKRRPPMSPISGVSASAVQGAQAPRAASAAVDADGDHDGTRAVASKPAAAAPPPARPTATLGNYLDVHA